MTEKYYNSIRRFITAKKLRLILFTAIYNFLPAVVFVSYFILLIYLYLHSDERIMPCFFIPLFVFVSVSLVRKILNFNRPYEKLDIEPVFPKKTHGQSFPSRHTASAAVIAMAFLYVNTCLGIVFWIIAALIAVSRICAGVHFLKDVAVGIIFPVVISLLFF